MAKYFFFVINFLFIISACGKERIVKVDAMKSQEATDELAEDFDDSLAPEEDNKNVSEYTDENIKSFIDNTSKTLDKPILGQVEFITQEKADTIDFSQAEISWRSIGGNLALEDIFYESKICEERYCASSTCSSYTISQENSRLISLLEFTPQYLCLRSISSDMVLQSDWIVSEGYNFPLEDIEISLENKVDTIDLGNSQNILLGTLAISRELSDYVFEIVPSENGEHDYFILEGDNNALVSFNSLKGIPTNLQTLTLTVKISDIDEIQSKSFNFSIQFPSSENNLIVNGSFDNNIDGWTLLNSDGPHEIVDENGDKFFQVNVGSSEDRVQARQVISLEANSKYTLSVKMSGTFNGTTTIPIVVDTKDLFDDTAQFTMLVESDWTVFAGSFTTGNEPVDVTIRLFQASSFTGTAKYDNIILRKNEN